MVFQYTFKTLNILLYQGLTEIAHEMEHICIRRCINQLLTLSYSIRGISYCNDPKGQMPLYITVLIQTSY